MVIGGSNVFSLLQGDFSFSGLGEKTQSTEFSSGKSDSKFFRLGLFFPQFWQLIFKERLTEQTGSYPILFGIKFQLTLKMKLFIT
jgi:hypothetical protein